MKQTLLVLLLSLMTVGLVGCASELKRAEQYYENGNYDDAIKSFEKVLARDGNNEDARIGLRRSREKWISQKLIEVRLARLAENWNLSLEQLDQIIKKQTLWQTYPAGVVAFTQKEEVEYASQRTKIEIDQALLAGKTLLAATIHQVRADFYQAERKKAYEALDLKIRTQGQSDCGKLSSKIGDNDFYYGSFTEKYCRFFGGKVPNLTKQTKAESANLSSSIDFVGTASEKSNGEFFKTGLAAKRLGESLEKRFRETPWYDSKGTARFKVASNTKFSLKHDVVPTKLEHTYYVFIPYTVTRTEPKDAVAKQQSSNFFSDVANVLTAVGTIATAFSGEPLPSYSETDNRDGTVTITETRYNKESRVMTYDAKEHRQNFDLLVSGTIAMKSGPVLFSHERNYVNSTYEHDNDRSDVGLSPRTPTLIAEEKWLEAEFQATSEKFKSSLVDSWKSRFCANLQTGLKFSPEPVFRCWRAGSDQLPHDFKTWFQTTFGVAPESAETLFANL